MSSITLTNYEQLFCMDTPGSALTNSTVKTLLTGNTSSNPAYQLPALISIWPAINNLVSKNLRAVARGTISTAASAPGTLTLGFQLDPTQNSSTSALTLAATGALTPAVSLASAKWELEFDITISAFGVTSAAYSATLQTGGQLTFGPGNNAATAAAVTYMVGADNIAMSGSALNPATPAWLELWGTWGTASASNIITCTQFLVYGQN